MTDGSRPSSVTWGPRTSSLASQLKSFSETIGGLGARISRIAESEPERRVENPLEVMQLEHEALLVAEEELRVQLDELEAAEARIQSERARYEALFAAAPDAYAITDRYGVVQEANPAMGRLLGIELRFLVKKPLATFIGPSDAARFRDLLSAGIAGPCATLDLTIVPRHEQGSVVCGAAVSTLPSRQLFWRFRDPRADAARRVPTIPPQNEIEQGSVEVLHELRDSLEHERAARVTHENASRAKDRLLALVSHDLRGPLHASLGWARLLKKTRRDPLRDRAIAAIERSGQTQLALVESLLDVAHIGEGTFTVERAPLDLSSLITHCVEAMLARAAAAAVELRWHVPEGPVTVDGDEMRLRRVITELVDNALKFTPAGGSVRVSLACEASGTAVLCVRDTGRGIDHAELAELFDGFAQARPQRQSREGLGLGLYVARHVVERHGGTIHAQSDGPKQGSVFTVHLPLERDRTPTPAPSSTRLDRALRGLELLVVCEDDNTNALLADELRRHSASVSTASDEATALAMFDAISPDAVVIDVSEKLHRGAALVRALRGRLHGDVPIIAVSPASEIEVATIVDAGVDAHLAKPFTSDELVSVLVDAAHRK